MSKVKKNLLYSFVGKLGSSAITFLMLPLYLPILGKEAFGLVSLAVALLQIVTFLNDALQPVWVKEIASRQAQSSPVWPLIRMQEYARGLILIIVLVCYPVISNSFLSSMQFTEISKELATDCFGILLITLALNIFGALYGLVFWGKQESYKLTPLYFGKSVYDSVGAYIVLLLSAGNIKYFFIWQLIGAIIFAFILASMVWRPLRKDFFKGKITKQDFLSIRNLGVLSLIMAFFWNSIVFTERWLIGSILSVSAIGIWSLMLNPVSLVTTLVNQIQGQLMPRFSELSSQNDYKKLGFLFVKGCKLVTFLLFFPMICFIIMPEELFFLWLRDADLAAQLAKIAPYGMIMTAVSIHGILMYQVDLAFDKMRTRTIATGVRFLLVAALWWILLKEFELKGIIIGHICLNLLECLGSGYLVFKKHHAANINYVKWTFVAFILPSALLVTYYLIFNILGSAINIEDSSLLVRITVKSGYIAIMFSISIIFFDSFKQPFMELMNYTLKMRHKFKRVKGT